MTINLNENREFIYAHAHMHTMVKVISLSEDAYKTLSSLKSEDESFSDVVIKLAKTRKKGDIMSLFGCAKGDKEFIKGLKKAYKERKNFKLRTY